MRHGIRRIATQLLRTRYIHSGELQQPVRGGIKYNVWAKLPYN
jgi:hypothetical protein